jgi:hypothetical protein
MGRAVAWNTSPWLKELGAVMSCYFYKLGDNSSLMWLFSRALAWGCLCELSTLPKVLILQPLQQLPNLPQPATI